MQSANVSARGMPVAVRTNLRSVLLSTVLRRWDRSGVVRGSVSLALVTCFRSAHPHAHAAAIVSALSLRSRYLAEAGRLCDLDRHSTTVTMRRPAIRQGNNAIAVETSPLRVAHCDREHNFLARQESPCPALMLDSSPLALWRQRGQLLGGWLGLAFANAPGVTRAPR